MEPRDHTGRRFGRLRAVQLAARKPVRWLFKCDCGNVKIVRMSSVLGGRNRSCGCLHAERCATGLNRLRHGDARVGKVTRLHSLWRGMLKRCNPSNNKFAIERYAARGIGVSEEWRDCVVFKAWAMANGYADNLSLDRIDNECGYSAENCRWADRTTQARNRRSSRFITLAGETKTLSEWCELYGLSSSVVVTRLARGWDAKRAITTPVKKIRKSW